MLLAVTLTLLALVLFVVVLAATRPDAFLVERSARIRARPERIYPLLDDFRAWGSWSPWEKLDPQMQRTFGGAPRGEGASYAWDSAGKAGAGSMQITGADAPGELTIRLEFLRPFAASNVAAFRLVPDGDATRLTWSMTGRRPFMVKLMSLFLDMDELVGKDFETGLGAIKSLAEA